MVTYTVPYKFMSHSNELKTSYIKDILYNLENL